jgi:hypothetical protein
VTRTSVTGGADVGGRFPRSTSLRRTRRARACSCCPASPEPHSKCRAT